MPNIALNSKKEQIQLGYRVDPSSPQHLVLKQETYTCIYCNSSMTLRCGLHRRAHFAHKTTCIVKWNHESNEHIFAKYFLQNLISTSLGLLVKQEVHIETQNRIADLLVFTSAGKKIAIEIQLSKISIEEINERTRDYKENNIDVIWMLDSHKFNNANISNSFMINIKTTDDEDFNFEIVEVKSYHRTIPINIFLFYILELCIIHYISMSKGPEQLSNFVYGNSNYVDEFRRFFELEYQYEIITPKDVINFIKEKQLIKDMSDKIREEEREKLILSFSYERAQLNLIRQSLNIDEIEKKHKEDRFMIMEIHRKEKEKIHLEINKLKDEIKSWQDYEADMESTLKKRYIDPELRRLKLLENKNHK